MAASTRPDRTRRLAPYAPAVLVLLPLLLNLTAITGWLDANPMSDTAFIGLHADPGLLPGGAGVTDPNVGMTTQALGHLAATEWLAGQVPWWNPYSGIGMPLAAEMQPSALFLPFSLLLALPNGVLWLKIAMQIVAGLGTWALLRRLGLGRMAALAGGVLFGVNGSFGWYGGYAPCLPIAFLPFFLLGLEHAADAAREGRPGGWALIAIALAYSLYAGFPETAFIDGLFALAWALLRIFELPEGAGGAMLRKVVLGGALGLMLAAPVVVPFLDLLRHGTLGERLSGAIAVQGVPPRFRAILLFPHLFGLPSGFLDRDPGGTIFELFALNGGWLGLVLAFLALLGLLHRPDRAPLRWLLGVWMLLSLGKTMALPGITFLLNLIPVIPDICFPRYGPPSWEMAAVVLAACALDDWRRGSGAGPRPLAAAALLVTALSALVLHDALPVMRLLAGEVAEYPWYPGLSIAGAGACLLAAVLAMRARPRPAAALAVVAIVTAEAATLYFVPMLAGLREVRLDLKTVAFLQDKLGLQRFLTYGPLHANYGAYFRIAGLNHEVIPVPEPWASAVTRRIDARRLVSEFYGGYPPSDGRPRATQLRALVPEYERLGVRYVLAFAGEHPFNPPPWWQDALRPDGKAPLALGPGESVSGTLPPAGDMIVPGAAVTIGTYAGAANGQLDITLCAGTDCATGRGPLAGAADNQPFAVSFPAPLSVPGGTKLNWIIAHSGPNSGTQAGPAHPVAIWLWPPRDGGPPAPRLTPLADGPRLAHNTERIDVWELPDPRPYFEAPGCTLQPRGREGVRAACPAPAVLVRRELAYPGWRASINDAAAAIAPADELFQSVALPAGDSTVRFTYRPPFMRMSLGAFGLAAIVLIAGALRHARRPFRRPA